MTEFRLGPHFSFQAKLESLDEMCLRLCCAILVLAFSLRQWYLFIDYWSIQTKVPVQVQEIPYVTEFTPGLFPSHRYSNTRDLMNAVDRGMHIINARSGCKIASWTYVGDGNPLRQATRDDCRYASNRRAVSLNATNIAQVKEGDTIYVLFLHLDHFCTQFLPLLDVNIVVISSQFHLVPVPVLSTENAKAIVNNPHVLAWFMRDAEIYSNGQEWHRKVFGFPLGLKPVRRRMKDYQNPIPTYQQVFMENLKESKTIDVFFTYTRDTTDSRRNLPTNDNVTLLSYPDYLHQISKSRYVLAPNGNRPETHRTYESLGLGAIPITELHPHMYRHLQEGPVMYNTTNWTEAIAEARSRPDMGSLGVNRNMIFEEYWMEYVERCVGRTLMWWDRCVEAPAMLVDFQINCSIES